ncbi:AAA family ATPase [Curtobacterium sp. A7_M15]|uniref:AAA family ATPase n=1 Tax=Curtobacterium sp. A7_M15 TaxID=3065241 RepID=UPI002737BD6C|nr:AAA family ATPase [Curtobacterium sp. A7_M15]MDP4332642.1 AAA family ATPase [Curtobacterium sp. A7_M15]
MTEQTIDRPRSPFNPGYGRQPLVFGGHEREIEELTRVFTTLDFGENHSILIAGLRGAGKTSMLTLLQHAATDAGWLVISDDASSGLMERVMETTIPSLINALDTGTKGRLTGLGIWEFNAAWEYQDRRREVKPLLRNDLVALSNAIDNRGILITIDEVSSGRVRLRELAKFALQVSHALTDGANIMIAFAGIRIDLDELLKQEHATFLRRSRDLTFERLDPHATMAVLRETAEVGGRAVAPDALRRLAEIAQGYPYLIQLVGDYAWRARVEAPTIELEDAEVAFEKAIKAVMNRVISKVYLDLSDKDREFVRAMTMALVDGRAKMSRIVALMGESDQYVQVYKRRLIDTGYVQRAGHGFVSFTLPYLDQYIRSLISDDLPDDREAADDWADFPAPQI